MKSKLTKERYIYILKKLNFLHVLSNSRNPFLLAKLFEIPIRFYDLEGVPGFIDKSSQTIFIDKKLDYQSKMIVCAHELGHLILHRTDTSFNLFNTGIDTVTEFEANVFAFLFLPKHMFSKSLADFQTMSDFNNYIESCLVDLSDSTNF